MNISSEIGTRLGAQLRGVGKALGLLVCLVTLPSIAGATDPCDPLEAKLDAVEVKLDAQASAEAALETKLDDHTTSLDALEGKADQQSLNVAAVEAKLDALEVKLDAQTSADAAVESKLDAVEVKVDAQTSADAAVESKLDAVEAKLDTQTSSVASLESKLDAIEVKVDDLDGGGGGGGGCGRIELEVLEVNIKKFVYLLSATLCGVFIDVDNFVLHGGEVSDRKIDFEPLTSSTEFKHVATGVYLVKMDTKKVAASDLFKLTVEEGGDSGSILWAEAGKLHRATQ